MKVSENGRNSYETAGNMQWAVNVHLTPTPLLKEMG
jgi:hypothetical protein